MFVSPKTFCYHSIKILGKINKYFKFYFEKSSLSSKKTIYSTNSLDKCDETYKCFNKFSFGIKQPNLTFKHVEFKSTFHI